jgi:hypothetical protein
MPPPHPRSLSTIALLELFESAVSFFLDDLRLAEVKYRYSTRSASAPSTST